MDFAKRQQIMSEESHKQNKALNDHRAKAMKLENQRSQDEYAWLKKAQPNAKASMSVDNNAKKPTTPSTPIAKPKPAIMEEVKSYINSNPFFSY